MGHEVSISCFETAERVYRRHLAEHPMRHYAAVLTLHGAVRLAVASGSKSVREDTLTQLQPFLDGSVQKVGGSYDRMYRCGGNASAWLAMCGLAPDAIPVLVRHAEELIASHPRDRDGVFAKQNRPEAIWIDTAFAVCPFLLWTGMLADRPDFIDESCDQMWKMKEALLNPENGLYHQARGFTAPGRLSEDHWGRGNGWAAIGLVEIVADLPDAHPMAGPLREHYREFMAACLRTQDEAGLWHQEMTRPDSYAEMSGTGLILYAIGRGLEKGLLPNEYREAFVRGLCGMLGYVALDGSVYHCCRGCLNPGDGSIAAYMAREWMRNDAHAFGPVVLAFGQALTLGMREVGVEFRLAPPPEI